MKMLIVFSFLLAPALNLAAQQPKAGDAAHVQASGPAAKNQIKNIKQNLPAAVEEKKTPLARKKEQAKAVAEQETDEGGVLIDSRTDENSARQPEEANAPDGIPASYGQLKGALNDDGRNLLVFENEDGVISFVQVFVGKNAVGWKLVSRIRRSGD